MLIGVCLHILLPTRAKSPKAVVNLDCTQAQDEDKVQINPREFSDAFWFGILGIRIDLETVWSWIELSNKGNFGCFELKSSFACTDDSHLHFEVHSDGSCGQPRFWDRFPLLWSGCRLTHGALQGRVGFEVRVERTWSTTQLDYKDDKCPHGLRVGWSTPDTSLLLGENSFPRSFLGGVIWTRVVVVVIIVVVSCQVEMKILLRMTDVV